MKLDYASPGTTRPKSEVGTVFALLVSLGGFILFLLLLFACLQTHDWAPLIPTLLFGAATLYAVCALILRLVRR